MKYLLCLVALLLLCLSPNPSFGQPNSSEAKEKWPYEKEKKFLVTLEERYHKATRIDNILGIFHLKSRKREALLSKVEDYINGFIKENPHIVEEMIRKVEELNKKADEVKEVEFENLYVQSDENYFELRVQILELLNSLAITFPYSHYFSLASHNTKCRIELEQDIVGLDRLKPKQVENIEDSTNRLISYGFHKSESQGESRSSLQFEKAKSESQGKSRSSPKSRKSRSSKRTSLLQ